MITLVAGIQLDNNMIWTDEESWNPIISEVTTTVGGGRLRQAIVKPNEIGRQITLLSTDSTGWQRKTTVEALKNKCAENLDSFPLQFVYDELPTLTYNVMFRDDENAVEFEPLFQIAGNIPDYFWYIGSLKFEVVS